MGSVLMGRNERAAVKPAVLVGVFRVKWHDLGSAVEMSERHRVQARVKRLVLSSLKRARYTSCGSDPFAGDSYARPARQTRARRLSSAPLKIARPVNRLSRGCGYYYKVTRRYHKTWEHDNGLTVQAIRCREVATVVFAEHECYCEFHGNKRMRQQKWEAADSVADLVYQIKWAMSGQ